MGKQASKRARENQKVIRATSSIEGCRIVWDDGRFWIQRPVEESSAWDLFDASRQLGSLKEVQKAGRFTLSILYHGEVVKTVKRSPRRFVGPEDLTEVINNAWPASLNATVPSTVRDIDQFGRWIGLAVDYSEFREERTELTAAINDFLGVKKNWRPGSAHVSLGMGQLACLSDIDRIKKALPSTLNLLPAQGGF